MTMQSVFLAKTTSFKEKHFMSYLPFMIGLMSLLIGCTGGQWVKAGVAPETAQRDYGECQTLGSIQQPQGGTLGDKMGGRPDMSSLTVDQCMRGKGYEWVTEQARGR